MGRLKVGFLILMLVAAFSWFLVLVLRFSLVWFLGLVLRVSLVWFLGLVSLSWSLGLKTVSKNFVIELICVDGWFWFMVLGFGFLVLGSSVFFGGFNVTILVVIGFSFSWFRFSADFWFLLSGFSWFLVSLVFMLLHSSGKVVSFLVLLSFLGTPFVWFGFLVWVGLLGVVLWLVFVSGFLLVFVGLGWLAMVFGRAPWAGFWVCFVFWFRLSCGRVAGFSLFKLM